jgi:hypothetical protein
LGPSAVGSASFDIRQLLGSAKKDPPTLRKASVIAASPESPTEMQVDPPEMSSADTLAIAEAMDDLPPRVHPFNILFLPPLLTSFFHSVDPLVLLLEAGKLLAGAHPLRIPHLLLYVQPLYPFLLFCIFYSFGIRRDDP